MTKFEFLGDLSRLIEDLPKEDREQAMEYYEDYFADAGPEREQDVIKEFVSPAFLAEQLHEAASQHSEPDQEPESSSMRNPIFQQFSAEEAKKEEDALALKKKTKVDIKSIHAATSKIDKKQKNTAKQRSAAEDKAYTASLYSGPKKAMIVLLLIVTCPITLTVLGIMVGLFLLALGILVGLAALGIITIIISIATLLLSILSLLAIHIPNFIFALGSALLLFTAGCAICYLDHKLFTRGIPGAYFSIMVHVKNLKSKLNRFAMK